MREFQKYCDKQIILKFYFYDFERLINRIANKVNNFMTNN